MIRQGGGEDTMSVGTVRYGEDLVFHVSEPSENTPVSPARKNLNGDELSRYERGLSVSNTGLSTLSSIKYPMFLIPTKVVLDSPSVLTM